MKLHLSNTAGLNIVTAYGEGYVAINQQRYEGNVIVLPESVFTDWTTATPGSPRRNRHGEASGSGHRDRPAGHRQPPALPREP